MTIEVKHRYGNHGGIATEWELTVSENNPLEYGMFEKLPTDLFPVQHSCQHRFSKATKHGYKHFIILPVDLDNTLVGNVVIALAQLDIDRLTELLRECQEAALTIKRCKEAPEPKEKDVHTEHCCIEHKRCKYGDDDTCTVAGLGFKPSYPCNCDN
jgi:hypothetical protein